MKFSFLFLMAGLLGFTPHLESNKKMVEFKITNIRDAKKGNFVICIFNNSSNYQNGTTCIRKEVAKDQVKNKELTFSIAMPEGVYGAVLLDDENLNDEMDYGILLPKEGFGFSNHVPMIRKPQFHDFDFTVSNQSTNQPILIKVKYM